MRGRAMRKLGVALEFAFFGFVASDAAERRIPLQILIDGKTYAAALEDNVTARDIAARLPLELDMKRFGGHEFYAELPFRPEFAAERTSQVKAGHLYYWDGWNAFVINYIDSDIAPYEVVHLGEIGDKKVCERLAAAPERIGARVESVSGVAAGENPIGGSVAAKNVPGNSPLAL